MDEEATQSESALEESESGMNSAVEEFTEAEVSSVSSAGFEAWVADAAAISGAAASIGGIIGGLLNIFHAIAKLFGGNSESKKYKQKAEWARNKIENVLKLEGPINGEISDNNILNISSAKFPIVEYIIDVKVESPVDPTSHFTHHRI